MNVFSREGKKVGILTHGFEKFGHSLRMTGWYNEAVVEVLDQHGKCYGRYDISVVQSIFGLGNKRRIFWGKTHWARIKDLLDPEWRQGEEPHSSEMWSCEVDGVNRLHTLEEE